MVYVVIGFQIRYFQKSGLLVFALIAFLRFILTVDVLYPQMLNKDFERTEN